MLRKDKNLNQLITYENVVKNYIVTDTKHDIITCGHVQRMADKRWPNNRCNGCLQEG
jgi:hypothetical protein